MLTDRNIFTRFVEEGLCQNYWGWTHALGGGLAFVLLTKWFGLATIGAFITVLIASILWEIGEYIGLRFRGEINSTYGNIDRFYLDSAGDILLTVATVLLIILG